MKVDLYDTKGKKKTTGVELDDVVFKSEINERLLTQSVYVYLSNQRQSNAQTKGRGDVSGGGKKPWKQKGTGNARAGSSRSPIWVKGGVTFGPSNMMNYKRTISKKMRTLSIRSAFSKLAEANMIKVIEKFAPEKTKDVASIISNLKPEGKITFFQGEEEGLYKKAANMKNVDVKRIGEISTYDILNAGNLVLFKEDLEMISKLWGNKEEKVTKKQTKTTEKKSK